MSLPLLLWSAAVLARTDAGPNASGTTEHIHDTNEMISYASYPPGCGPSFYAYGKTFENFTVLQGQFNFDVYLNSESEVEHYVLDRCDFISVPPHVFRAFTSAGPEDGILQVTITGGGYDIDDIYFAASMPLKIAECDPAYLAFFEAQAMHFQGQK